MLKEIHRGLDSYDPSFGEAFYQGSWDTGFDHADTLASIDVPAVLIHANWSFNADGILMESVDDRDAERGRSLIKDVQFYGVDAGHGFHFEKPRDLTSVVVDIQARVPS